MPKQFGTPGPRSLYPTAATSSSLAACDPMAQLLFDRLIAAADDQGRQLGDVTLVKAACLPLIRSATTVVVDRCLDQLAAQRMVQRYTAGGLPLIQIVNWWTFQQQRHVWPSRWSPPRGWDQDIVRGHGTSAVMANGRIPADDGGPTGGPPGADVPPPGAERRPRNDVSRGPLPRTRGAVPGRAGPSHAGAVGRAAARTAEAAPPAPRGQRLTGNGYAAWEVLTGSPPSDKQRAWLDDECGRYGRDAVVHAMYEVPEPTKRGWFNRVKDQLRGKGETPAPRPRSAGPRPSGATS